MQCAGRVSASPSPATYVEQDRRPFEHAELGALPAHLGALGVQTVMLRPSVGRRLARLVANLARADPVGTLLADCSRYRVVSTATSAPAVMKGAIGRTNRRPRPATRPTRTNTAAAPKATSVAVGRAVQPR